jgi:enoyl-CoA hydratase/carnithine racemase
MSSPATYELKDSVATITMDDGKVNALSVAMLSALNDALDRAVADRAVVVLTGRAGTFSAGFDLKTLTAGGDDAQKMVTMGFELAHRMLSFPTPIVVACNGHAIAMGVFLLLAADYRIGVDGPFKIGANEVAIGITMPYFGIEICRQRLAPAHFNRAVIFSEMYSPTDAVPAGFLDKVVPEADLRNEAKKFATALTKLNMTAHAASKLRLRDQTLKAIRGAIEADNGMVAPPRNGG